MKRLSLFAAVLLVPLFLSACTGDITPVSAVNALKVDGTLVSPITPLGTDDGAWMGGAGQITARFSAEVPELLSTPVSSSGAFTLDLKDAVDDSKLPVNDYFGNYSLCDDKSFSLSASNPGARSAALRLQVKTASLSLGEPIQNGKLTVTAAAATTPALFNIQSGGILYSNAANKVTGSKECASGGVLTTFTFNINLVKGWNSLLLESKFTRVGTETKASLTVTSGALLNRWAVVPKIPVAQPNSFSPLLNP